MDCSDVFDWDGISFRETASCSQWKATIAFSFLSAICWLASAILGYVSCLNSFFLILRHASTTFCSSVSLSGGFPYVSASSVALLTCTSTVSTGSAVILHRLKADITDAAVAGTARVYDLSVVPVTE